MLHIFSALKSKTLALEEKLKSAEATAAADVKTEFAVIRAHIEDLEGFLAPKAPAAPAAPAEQAQG